MLWILLTWGTAENIQALYAQKIVKKGLDVFLKPSDITILFIMVAGGVFPACVFGKCWLEWSQFCLFAWATEMPVLLLLKNMQEYINWDMCIVLFLVCLFVNEMLQMQITHVRFIVIEFHVVSNNSETKPLVHLSWEIIKPHTTKHAWHVLKQAYLIRLDSHLQ